MGSKTWLLFATITTLFWGVWGALIELPEKAGFPATLGYSVWALTMIPCSAVALKLVNWGLEYDRRAVLLGSVVGLLGAGWQLVLFETLRIGPAYLVFPLISLYPVVTIILSALLLKERASRLSWAGIVIALVAIALLSYQPPDSPANGYLWLLLALLVMAAWGIQACVMKFSNERMKAESIFFYMTVTGLALIPVAVVMTDFSQAINWGPKGPYLAALIQVLNSIGALCLVYAVRYGRAIIVIPMTALAPVITVVLSLLLYRRTPHPIVVSGMVLAAIAIYLMARGDVAEAPEAAPAASPGLQWGRLESSRAGNEYTGGL